MIQLTAIVDDKRATMLTELSIEQAGQSCRDRFGARFEGFAPVPLETVARAKWAEYQAKQVSRPELERWLAEQQEEQAIRALFNRFRGAKA